MILWVIMQATGRLRKATSNKTAAVRRLQEIREGQGGEDPDARRCGQETGGPNDGTQEHTTHSQKNVTIGTPEPYYQVIPDDPDAKINPTEANEQRPNQQRADHPRKTVAPGTPEPHYREITYEPDARIGAPGHTYRGILYDPDARMPPTKETEQRQSQKRTDHTKDDDAPIKKEKRTRPRTRRLA